MTPMRLASLLLLALGTACAGPAAPAAAAHANAAATEAITLGNLPWNVGDQYLSLSTTTGAFDIDGKHALLDMSVAASIRVRDVGPDGPTKVDVSYDAAISRVSLDGALPGDPPAIERGTLYTVWRDASGIHSTYGDGTTAPAPTVKRLASLNSRLGRRLPSHWIIEQPWQLRESRHASAFELARLNANTGTPDVFTEMSATLEELTDSTATFAIVLQGRSTTTAPLESTTYRAIIDRVTGRPVATVVTPDGSSDGVMLVEEVLW